MKVKFDGRADMIYIKLADAEIVDTRMLGEDVYVDVDKEENLGIEI